MLRAKKKANCLVVLSVVNDDRYHNNWLKPEILTQLKHMANEKGYTSMLATVRLNRKCEYPLTPFEQYVNWRQTDGSPFDPGLSVHWKLGATILGIMPRALKPEGSVKEWESWTGMGFTGSGEYVVDGAQSPVIIDQTDDRGYYAEPNIWVLHAI